jgi:hypothetical protein
VVDADYIPEGHLLVWLSQFEWMVVMMWLCTILNRNQKAGVVT